LARLQILTYTEADIQRYEQLRVMKLNVPKMDLPIAAIVLEHGATLVTRNTRDFQRVPNLVFVDWSK
jgi:tRNA(fMet)-specific endonuclease VapC